MKNVIGFEEGIENLNARDGLLPKRPAPRPRGIYALADLPQRESIAEHALGTGWWELDQIWKIYPGQFVVVTGIAGHGKSTFLLNVIANMAIVHGTRSFLFVPENEQSIFSKLKAIWGDRPCFEYFAREQCIVQSAVADYFGEDEPIDLRSVLDRAVACIERDNLDVLMIDPWNELEHLKPERQLMTDYIREALMYLKRICRQHSVTVILVAHPTKAVTENGGRLPNLSDIEGSMNWYNKCDNGLVVHRDFEHKSSKVISAKVREHGAGKIGSCHFFVDEQTGLFTPMHGAVT